MIFFIIFIEYKNILKYIKYKILLIIIPIVIKRTPPIVGVSPLIKWFLGPSNLIICLRLIFFSLGIIKKEVIDVTTDVIRKGSTKLLFLK